MNSEEADRSRLKRENRFWRVSTRPWRAWGSQDGKGLLGTAVGGCLLHGGGAEVSRCFREGGGGQGL